MLEIKDLHASVGDRDILKGLTLSINPGQIHAIMGPNGAGKSTLSHILTGRDGYEITAGSVTFMGQDILAMPAHERAIAGMFLSFQYPVEIPGVQTMAFLKAALNAVREGRGEEPLDAVSFLRIVRTKAKKLGITEDMLKRPLNSGFSGGEKKRCEALQMSLLAPKLCILDEADSGLDIDALKTVADAVNDLRSPERSMLVITHYQRLLDYIVPDFVHVLVDGVIARSGGKELALELERDGYRSFGIDEAAA